MTKSISIIVGLILLVVLVLFSMTYTVKYNEVAIRSRFGRTGPESIVRNPGLKFRLPLFADKITTIDTRLQLRESPLETIQTLDKQILLVRAYMLWHVDKEGEGPLKFFTHHPGGIEEGNQRLTEQFQTAIRTGLSRFTFDDLIGTRSRLADAEEAIKNDMKSVLDRGIEPVSVGISQMILSANTTRAVLNRMQATRSYLSDAERYKGDSEASGIESRADAQAAKIRAFALQRAEEIRAAGNKDAAKYIEAMAQDQGLAIFLAWIDALQSSLSEQTTFVMPTLMAPFHLLRLDTLTDSRGIPQPPAENGRLASEPAPTAPAASESPSKPTVAADVPGGS